MPRRALLRLLAASIACICTPAPAAAQQWHVAQGDLLRAEITLPASMDRVQVRAFGQTWPWRAGADGKSLLAWIGIDLKTRPGEYSLTWSAAGRNWTRTDTISVRRGEFRKSYITVDRKMAEFDAAALARIRADQASLKHAYGVVGQASPEIAISRPPVAGAVTTPFGAQRYVNGAARSPHSGLDIAAGEGTPVINPLPGKVLLAESMFLNGNTVAIGHGHVLVMVYSHLKAMMVREGDWLEAGETLGLVGMSGRATGPHLHWGVRFQGARINPDELCAIPAGRCFASD